MEKLRNFVQITYTLHAKEKIEAKIKRKDRNICESMKISFSITYYSKSKHEADWHFPTIQKSFLRIWSHLLKKFLMKNFIF